MNKKLSACHKTIQQEWSGIGRLTLTCEFLTIFFLRMCVPLSIRGFSCIFIKLLIKPRTILIFSHSLLLIYLLSLQLMHIHIASANLKTILLRIFLLTANIILFQEIENYRIATFRGLSDNPDNFYNKTN